MQTLTTGTVPQFYRDNELFTKAELQVMCAQGTLQWMLGDVYAEASSPLSPELRAGACQGLLSPTLRREGVLCGETAAWVYLGGTPPQRPAVITPGIYRRQTERGQWQLHLRKLDPEEETSIAGYRITSGLSTTADMYLGIGVQGNPRPMDQLPMNSPGATSAQHYGQRLQRIAQLIRHFDISPAELQQIIVLRYQPKRSQSWDEEQITEALKRCYSTERCYSRRLPTVR